MNTPQLSQGAAGNIKGKAGLSMGSILAMQMQSSVRSRRRPAKTTPLMPAYFSAAVAQRAGRECLTDGEVNEMEAAKGYAHECDSL